MSTPANNEQEINRAAKEAEASGRLADAVEQYELNLLNGATGHLPYWRLAEIYRQHRRYNDEIRVLRRYLEHPQFQDSAQRGNDNKRREFQARLQEANALKDEHADKEPKLIENQAETSTHASTTEARRADIDKGNVMIIGCSGVGGGVIAAILILAGLTGRISWSIVALCIVAIIVGFVSLTWRLMEE